jgi:predicted deacetylase
MSKRSDHGTEPHAKTHEITQRRVVGRLDNLCVLGHQSFVGPRHRMSPPAGKVLDARELEPIVPIEQAKAPLQSRPIDRQSLCLGEVRQPRQARHQRVVPSATHHAALRSGRRILLIWRVRCRMSAEHI